MTAEKRTKIENYFGVQTLNFVVVGIWFDVERILNISPRTARILNWIYDIFILTLLSHIFILYIFTLKNRLDDPETSFDEITDAISQIIVYGFAGFMHYYSRIRSKRHIELLTFINANFRYRSARGLTYVTSEPSYLVTKKLSFYWTICGVVGTLQFALYPIIMQERILPLKLTYPFETLKSPTYEILMILQSIAQVSVGFGFLVCVNYGAVVAMLIGNQYDVLNCSLKNILYTAMHKAGKAADIRNLQYKNTVECEESIYYMNKEKLDNFDDSIATNQVNDNASPHTFLSIDSPSTNEMNLHKELCESLRESVLHHQIVTEACKMLEDVMHPVILVKYLQVTALLCTMFVTILKVSGPVMITFTEYSMLAIFDLAMLSYSGEILKQESMKVGSALMRSPWYRFDIKFQKLVIIVLSNTQKPLLMTGGKFFDLGWDLFVTSLKLSFSCFTLLNKLGSK